MIASLAIISETTSPAPRRFTSRRKGRSLTPDIGARMTGSSNVTEPTEMPMEYANTLSAYGLGINFRPFHFAAQHRCPAVARDSKRSHVGISCRRVVGLRARGRGGPRQPLRRPVAEAIPAPRGRQYLAPYDRCARRAPANRRSLG